MPGLRWLTASALLVPCIAQAWGAEGHRIVALIAERELAPQVREKVLAMLAQDTNPLTEHDIASEAVWADKFRDDNPTLTQSWHYANIDLHQKDLAAVCTLGARPDISSHRGHSKVCVVDKIEQFAAELHSAQTPANERLLALKFLLHLVGDVHQPLHASDDHDAGGNAKQVKTAAGTLMTLHSYWDTALVRQLGRDAHKVAHKLAGMITEADRHAWKTGSARDWAMESFGIASRFVYAGLPAPDEQVYVLSPRYETAALDHASMQLKRAGVRLAVVLNEALADR